MSPRPPAEDLTTFAGRWCALIRARREQLGFKTSHVAKEMGIADSTYRAWENPANPRFPNVTELPALASALGLRVRNILPVE